MNRKAVSGLVLTLLFVSMLTFPLHPIQATPTPRALEANVGGKPGHRQLGLTSPTPEWNRTYGGTNYDYAEGVVQTGDGGYVLAGRTRSFGAGGYDFWLVKTDASGNVVWNQTYGGTDDDRAYSVVQTGDGGYALAGYTTSSGVGFADFWLVKTDASGNVVWNQTYGGTGYDKAYSVIQMSDGGYALTGQTMSFSTGPADSWLVKTDASGSVEWNQTYGGSNLDVTRSVVETVDGGYALVGYTGSFGAGVGDFWLVKTDASGNVVWNQTYGGTNYDWAWSGVETGDGGYVLAGYTGSFGAGDYDFWLVKTDAFGNMQWNQTYGGIDDDWGRSVVLTGDGGYAIAGQTYSFGVGVGDFWLVKTDATGNAEWNQTYGGTDDDWGYFVVETGDGGYALTGSTFSFGAGSADFWLVKTEGEPKETAVFFNVSPNPASVGETVTLRGILVDESSQPLSNESIKLYGRRLAGSWRYVIPLTTDEYGMFMWQVQILFEGVFILAVYYSGSENYDISYSFAMLIVQ